MLHVRVPVHGGLPRDPSFFLGSHWEGDLRFDLIKIDALSL